MLHLEIDKFAGEDGAERSVSEIGASELLQYHNDGNGFVQKFFLEDRVFEASCPVEIEIHQVVLLQGLESRFDALSADFGLFVVVFVELENERHVELPIVDSLHDEGHDHIRSFCRLNIIGQLCLRR